MSKRLIIVLSVLTILSTVRFICAEAPAKRFLDAGSMSAEVNISGQWNSNIGAVYEIQQNGNQFTWAAPSLGQTGTGTISENAITIDGPGWTVKGTITKTDASGNAIEIAGEMFPSSPIRFATSSVMRVPFVYTMKNSVGCFSTRRSWRKV